MNDLPMITAWKHIVILKQNFVSLFDAQLFKKMVHFMLSVFR